MNRDKRRITSIPFVLGLIALVSALGCARSPGAGALGDGQTGSVPRRGLVQTAAADPDEDAEDYDPWQGFNEHMFAFNQRVLDRYLVKPAATGWEKVVPAVARRSLARLFDNLEMPRRLMNNLLQARPIGAGREVARFAINTTVGLVGLFDVADAMHLEPSEADAGETLALYGVGAGPYLVLPTMPPLTVRDAIGRGIDGALDPIGYLLPFVANRVKSIVSAINERSLNLTLFANVEDTVLDLYSAARNGYLQRRRIAIHRAIEDRDAEWAWAFAPGPDKPVAASAPRPEDPA